MRPYAALPAAALLLAIALRIAPHVALGETATDVSTFVGAALISLTALGILARESAPRARPWVAGASLATFVIVALLHLASPWAKIAIDIALLGGAHLIGGGIGRRVQHAGHLLPATVVAACADVVSVLTPEGPTHQILQSEQALTLTAFSFPVAGAFAMAPALGAGDLVMVALWMGAAVRHGLPLGRVVALSIAGALVAMGASALGGTAVPALPAIGLLLLLGVPASRKLAAKDRQVAALSIAVAIVVALAVVVRQRLAGR